MCSNVVHTQGGNNFNQYSGALIISYSAVKAPSVDVAITAGAQTICAGTSVSFKATPTAFTAPLYQWQKNGANVGS